MLVVAEAIAGCRATPTTNAIVHQRALYVERERPAPPESECLLGGDVLMSAHAAARECGRWLPA